MAQSKYPVLKDLGLSEGEIEVFEALLSLGRAKASDLVPKTSLKRANLYHVLGSLQNKGLISAIEAKQTVFEPRDPSILWQLFETRKQLLERTKADLSATLPFIASDLNKTLGKPSIQIFEGLEGAETAIYQTLEAKSTIYSFIDTATIEKHPELLKIDQAYAKQRIRKGIKKQILVTDNPFNRSLFSDYDESTTEVRFLAQFPDNFASTFQFYDNTTIVLSLNPTSIISVSLNDATITSFLKQLFAFLWAQATPQE